VVAVCDAGKLLDEIVASAFNDQSRFDVLGSSVARHDAESVFLWQVAVGLPVEPAAAVISTMHRSALHSGNSVSLVNFLLSSSCFSSYLITCTCTSAMLVEHVLFLLFIVFVHDCNQPTTVTLSSHVHGPLSLAAAVSALSMISPRVRVRVNVSIVLGIATGGYSWGHWI